MNKEVKGTVFSVTFLLGFGILNLYIFEHIAAIFALEKGMLYHFFFVLAIFAYFPAVMLEALIGKWYSRLFYIVVVSWMGLVLIYSVLFALTDILWVFNVYLWDYGLYILLLGVVVGILGFINASILQVYRIKIYADIKSDYRIVHVSDIHLGPIRKRRFLEKIVYKINQLDPDVVLITGDLFDWRYKYQKTDFKSLKDIKAQTYFSIGNHEVYTGVGYVESMLEGTNVKILRNSFSFYKDLQIVGIDDSEDGSQLKRELSKISLAKGKYHILMYHRPDSYKDVLGIDLMLSGHTHAGQIFPFNYVAWFMSRPVRGLHEFHGIRLYVTHGAGTWGPPIRLGCRSEIVCIDLHSKDNSKPEKY